MGSNDHRVTLDEATFNDIFHANCGTAGLGALASRCIRAGLAALLADGSLERQPVLPAVAPAPAQKPAEPALPETMRAVLSKLNGAAVEGTAEELCAQGWGTSPVGLSHTLHAMADRGLIAREHTGYRPSGRHGTPVAVWRIAKAVAS